jgi:hypothetical protein
MTTSNLERAVFAGGCFWGMQELIRKLPGVVGTRVGYTGGDVPNATYRNHGSHAEAIEIEYDPTRISYRDLLEFFLQIHDPTTLNRQGNDVGTSQGRRPLPLASITNLRPVRIVTTGSPGRRRWRGSALYSEAERTALACDRPDEIASDDLGSWN